MQRFRDGMVGFIAATLVFSASYAGYQYVQNTAILERNRVRIPALDKTQKLGLFPYCVTTGSPDTEEWTVCGNIESIEVGNDRWDKKEVKP